MYFLFSFKYLIMDLFNLVCFFVMKENKLSLSSR